MGALGPPTLRAGQHRTRRYTFLGLLLLALIAPAGWVMAGESSQPYIVVFNEAAVTTVDSWAGSTGAERPVTFRRLAMPTAMQAAEVRTSRSSTAGDDPGRRRVDGARVISHVRELATRHGLHVDSVYSSALGGFASRLTPSQLRALARDPVVGAILPDEAIALDEGSVGDSAGGVRTTGNPGVSVPPGIRRIGARGSAVTGVRGGGAPVDADVAIIDTGVQRDHPDLNVVGGYNCTSRNRGRWDDTNGHGTHVAGIVGALENRIGVVGVAPGVRLWSVKVLDSRGRGFLSWMVCGVDWVTAQREGRGQSRPLIEVANMSISFSLSGSDRECGVPAYDSLHMAICRSVSAGTTYVVAAGNDSRNARRNRPAAYDEVITVSALADYDGRGGGRGQPSDSCPYWSPEADDAFAGFSNFGPDVDLIAPGKCVLSTYMRSRYGWMSGTSMATPHVSGAAALYRSKYPSAKPQQVRLALQAVATLDWRTATDPDRGTPERAVWVGQFRTMPDFSLRAGGPGTSTSPGGTLTIPVTLRRVGGFNDPITISLAEPPPGLTAQPVALSQNAGTLGVDVGGDTRAGRYTLTVRALSGELERSATVAVVIEGRPPRATFVSPADGLSLQSAGSVTVAWTEVGGGAPISARRLDRQLGRIVSPGTCAGVRYATDISQADARATTQRTRAGFCYRWRLALRDRAGYRATVYSGSVLVDATAPGAPSVSLGGRTVAIDLDQLGLSRAYVGHSGTLWVRGGSTGTIDLDVRAGDPQSGIAANNATLRGGSGWSVSWLGRSTAGALRVGYAARGGPSTLSVYSTNGAGLDGPATVGTLVRDATPPRAVVWVSAPSGTTVRTAATNLRLDWRAGSDVGSGLAQRQLIRRYRAALTTNGSCRRNGFTADGPFRLAADGAPETDLQPGSCYVWSVRTLDNVGNYAASVVSGYVIVEARRR